MKDLSELNNNDTEYFDFCGQYKPDFSNINQDIFSLLNDPEHINAFYDRTLTFLMRHVGSMDDCMPYMLYAFSKGIINREQMASILEYKEIMKTFEMVEMHPMFNESKEFTDHFKKTLSNFISFPQHDKFKILIQEKPLSEQFYYTFNKLNDINEDPRIEGLLELASNYRVMYKSPQPSITRHGYPEAQTIRNDETESDRTSSTFVLFSISGRQAFFQTEYGVHYKQIYPRLGNFTIEEMDDSIRRFGRYYAVSYPGIVDATSFHNVTAKPLYLSWHDNFHCALVSTIPNSIYTAGLKAIDVVREKTKIKWSKEIWEFLDMEVGLFGQLSRAERDQLSVVKITKSFFDFLNHPILTENRTNGLFTGSPYVDTTWLLLIDMVENYSSWCESNIDPSLLEPSSVYHQLYHFVKEQYHAIKDKTPAEQVAIIKSSYLNLTDSLDGNIVFIRSKKSRYLQVVIDNKPLGIDKFSFLVMYDKLPGFESLAQNNLSLLSLAQSPQDLFAIAKDVDPIIQGKVLAHFYDKYPTVEDDVLIDFIKGFPEFNNEFFTSIISKRLELPITEHSLRKITQLFPDKNSIIFRIVMNQPIANILGMLHNAYVLMLFSEQFPNHKEELVQILLERELLSKQVLTNDYTLKITTDTFPNYTDELKRKYHSIKASTDRLSIFSENTNLLFGKKTKNQVSIDADRSNDCEPKIK